MDPFSQGSPGKPNAIASIQIFPLARDLVRRRYLCDPPKSHCLLLTAVFFLLCGCNGGSSGGIQVQPQWTFAVLCDTRGDNNAANLYKSGVNEVVVDSMTRDLVKEGAELVIFPGDLVNG